VQRPILVALAMLLSSCNPQVETRAATEEPAGHPTRLFEATAYCHGTITKSGTRVGPGVIAADPAVLPLGTAVRISGIADAYDGVYVVLDTGSAIRGRRIDVYMPNCREAVRFGRRPAEVTVIDQ
jgi:3D (Asp-Asp-Asp) domain-containing protein